MSGMSLEHFQDLTQYATRPFPSGYPVDDHITLCAPDDKLAEALAFLIDQARCSVSVVLRTLTSEALGMAILRKLQAPKVTTTLILPYPEALGAQFEEKIQALADAEGNRVLFSQYTSVRLPIMGTVDGLDSFTGSADELTFTRHPLVAHRVQDHIDRAALAIGK